MSEDDEYGLDEDLDDELFQVIEAAEKQHQSQVPIKAVVLPTNSNTRYNARPQSHFNKAQSVPLGRAGPPRKPVYRDDFPNVEVDNKGAYRKRDNQRDNQNNASKSSTVSDDEKERMRIELEQVGKKKENISALPNNKPDAFLAQDGSERGKEDPYDERRRSQDSEKWCRKNC